MKKIFFVIALAVTTTATFGQGRFLTKNGKIYFDCTTPSSPEKIDGTNDKATSVIDASTGAIEFALLMKAFVLVIILSYDINGMLNIILLYSYFYLFFSIFYLIMIVFLVSF